MVATRLASISVFAALSTGCMAATVLQRPEITAEGEFEVAASIGAGLLTEAHDGPIERWAINPAVEVAGRYGLTDATDVGVRIGGVGPAGAIELKHRIGDGPVRLFVAPILRASHQTGACIDCKRENPRAGDDLTIVALDLPLILAIDLEDGAVLSIGPRAIVGPVWRTNSDVVVTGLAGLYAQFAARVTEEFWVAPELSVLVSQAGPLPDTFTQVALGMFFGGEAPPVGFVELE